MPTKYHPQNKCYGAFGGHTEPKLRTFQRGVEFVSRREWSRRRKQNPAPTCTHILDRRLRRAMREIPPERNYVVRRAAPPKAAARPKKASRQNSAAMLAAMIGLAASAMAQLPKPLPVRVGKS